MFLQNPKINYTLVLLIIATIAPYAHSQVHLFAHGLGGDWSCIRPYRMTGIVKPESSVSFNSAEIVRNPDATYTLDYSRVYMGQQGNVDHLVHTLNTHKARLPEFYANKKLIGIGHSMGGATLLNTAGQHPALFDALILDSTFSHADNVAYSRADHLGLGFVGKTVASWTMKFIFPKYNLSGLQPITSLASIPDIPILFIHSKEDTLIDYSEAIALYQERVRLGMRHSYLLILDHGDHQCILDGQDSEKIIKTVHAFYKKYGFQHDAHLANRIIIDQFQPNITS